MGDSYGAMGGLIVVALIVWFCAFRVPVLARRVRDAWRDLNRPLP